MVNHIEIKGSYLIRINVFQPSFYMTRVQTWFKTSPMQAPHLRVDVTILFKANDFIKCVLAGREEIFAFHMLKKIINTKSQFITVN